MAKESKKKREPTKYIITNTVGGGTTTIIDLGEGIDCDVTLKDGNGKLRALLRWDLREVAQEIRKAKELPYLTLETIQLPPQPKNPKPEIKGISLESMLESPGFWRHFELLMLDSTGDPKLKREFIKILREKVEKALAFKSGRQPGSISNVTEYVLKLAMDYIDESARWIYDHKADKKIIGSMPFGTFRNTISGNKKVAAARKKARTKARMKK